MSGNVLVVGGAGYVGSHACKALSRQGWNPVVYDDLSRGNNWSLKWGDFERGDIKDKNRLMQIITIYKPVAVMHFAALCYVEESTRRPQEYYNTNVYGTLCLLDAMKAHEVNRIVFSSSCATYGIPSQIPIPDGHEQRPISPYGASKHMCERLLADYGDAYGLKSASLRYFNAAGADLENEIGEFHEPETHLIPNAIRAALSSDVQFFVYGTDFDTEDGTAVRDYIHVDDLADAHVAALQHLMNDGATVSMNLGTERGYSVSQIVRTIEGLTGQKVRQQTKPRRPGDPAVLIADSERARRILGWTPRSSDIETIIGTAIDWHNKIQSQ